MLHLIKSKVKAHTRKTKGGKTVMVREHTDKRVKKTAKQAKESGPVLADRFKIAKRYADIMVERAGHSGDVGDMHYRTADAIIDKDAYALEHLANGLNEGAKKVFSEFTGIKLPKQQGKTWEIIRKWGGVSAKDDASRKLRSSLRAKEKHARYTHGDELVDQIKGAVEKLYKQGARKVEKIGRSTWLLNPKTQMGTNISQKGFGPHKQFILSYMEYLNQNKGKPMENELKKSKVKAHARKLKSGKTIMVKEHTDSRTKKPAKKPVAKKVVAKKKPAVKKDAPKAVALVKPKKKKKRVYVDKGEKIGGAKKDRWKDILEGRRRMLPSDLEGMDDGTQLKAVIKRSVMLGVIDEFRSSGMRPGAAWAMSKLFGMIAQKPKDTEQDRINYVMAMDKLVNTFRDRRTLLQVTDGFVELMAEARGFKMKPAEKKKYDALEKVFNAWDKKRKKKWQEMVKDYWRPGNRQKLDKKWREWLSVAEKKTKDKRVEFLKFKRKLEKREEENPTSVRNQLISLGDRFAKLISKFKSPTRDRFLKNLSEAANVKNWDWLSGKKAAGTGNQKVKRPKWIREVPDKVARSGGSNRQFKPEQLLSEYGIRGVEYGNYVDEESGRHHTKMLGLSFMDLAEILKINPKLISNKKRLAIAFGARGTGGASAHYESGKKVINMTKNRGGGSLAHEWGHFFDNIVHMASTGGVAKFSFMSNVPSGYRHTGEAGSAVSSEVVDAYTRLNKAMMSGTKGGKKSDPEKNRFRSIGMVDTALSKGMPPQEAMSRIASTFTSGPNSYYYDKYPRKRMNKLAEYANYIHHKTGQEVTYGGSSSGFYVGSKNMGGEYWTRPHEMFARAFEAYVSDKMTKMKMVNTYLVSGVTESGAMRWADAVESHYPPYPVGTERKAINKEFDGLFAAIRKDKTLRKAIVELMA